MSLAHTFELTSSNEQHAMSSESSPCKIGNPPLTSSAHTHMRSAHMFELSSSDEQHVMFRDSRPEVDSPWNTGNSLWSVLHTHTHMRSTHMFELSCSDEQHAMFRDSSSEAGQPSQNYKSSSGQFCTPELDFEIPQTRGSHTQVLLGSSSLRLPTFFIAFLLIIKNGQLQPS